MVIRMKMMTNDVTESMIFVKKVMKSVEWGSRSEWGSRLFAGADGAKPRRTTNSAQFEEVTKAANDQIIILVYRWRKPGSP